jgi:hypothetical protein
MLRGRGGAALELHFLASGANTVHQVLRSAGKGTTPLHPTSLWNLLRKGSSGGSEFCLRMHESKLNCGGHEPRKATTTRHPCHTTRLHCDIALAAAIFLKAISTRESLFSRVHARG